MTILFLDDWKKYPGAIIDTKTKNKSFIRLAALYRDMGIKNHGFLLQLHDPTLQGVDPFDPNLTFEQIARIQLEVQNNFFYYIRECVRAPGGTETNPIQFKANRGNIALFWLFFNHIMTILIQIRQTGKSYSTDVLMTYLLNTCFELKINLLTKDDTLRAANLERLKEIEKLVPYYLRKRKPNDVGNTEVLKVSILGNKYEGHLPATSVKDANNVGRGLTSPIFQVDEAAFFRYISTSLPAALAAGTAARDIARRNGTPYGTILTTTAGKKDDRDGKYIFNMISSSAMWNEKFFDCKNIEELELLISKMTKSNEDNKADGTLRVACVFNHRQLGYTDEWLRRAIREAESVGDAADRDFFNRWTSGSQSSPLTVDMAKKVRDGQVGEFDIVTSGNGYVMRWYVPYDQIQATMAADHHIISVDSSDGAGRDDIGVVVKSIKTGEVVAVADVNEINLIDLAEWLMDLLVTYPNTTMIVERKSSGPMILDYLIKMCLARDIDPFARLYNKVVQEAEEYPDRFAEINKPMYMRDRSVYVDYKKHFGFATSGSGDTARDSLYGTVFQSAVRLTGGLIRDRKIIDQILGLVIRNNRVDHDVGGHDDLCVSWLLSHWLMLHGRNMQFYGIQPNKILSMNETNRLDNSPKAVYDRMMQERLKNEIADIIDQLEEERDQYIVARLERELRTKAIRLNENDRKILAVDDLIETLREERSPFGNEGHARVPNPMSMVGYY